MKLTTYEVLGRPEDVELVLKVIKRYSQFKHEPKSPYVHIVVGGDGSLVYKPNRERVYNSRILRVHCRKNSNTTQGYAADVNLTNLDLALKDIVDDNYFLQEEQLIDCFINGEKRDSAINDVSIINSKPLAMLLFDAILDDGKMKKEIPLRIGDMILVSTPYGSTAWDLSVGGPIIINLPDSMAINITGTTIKHEHYVTSSKNTFYVKVFCDALVGIDGRNPVYEIKNGDQIAVTQSDKRVHFIRTYSTLEGLRGKTKRQAMFPIEKIEKK